ncbi:MAG: hypothetical protein V7725_02385 [Porticoccus sp.]
MKKIVLATLIFILSACQSQTFYTLPTGVPLKDSATLEGSKVFTQNILLYGNEISYVLAIDGLPVKPRLWKNYNNLIKLSPGKHVVQIANKQGSLFAKVVLELNVQSRKRYIARGEVIDEENIRMWIEDNEKNKVTKILVVPRSKRITGGGFIFI